MLISSRLPRSSPGRGVAPVRASATGRDGGKGSRTKGRLGPAKARSTSPHSLTLLDPGAVSDSLIRISSLLDGNCWGYNNNHYTQATPHMIIIFLGWNYVDSFNEAIFPRTTINIFIVPHLVFLCSYQSNILGYQ